MTTATTDRKPDAPPKSDAAVKSTWIAGGFTVLAALIGAFSGYLGAVRLHDGPGDQKDAVPGKIVTPVQGEKVGMCPAIRGIAAPAAGKTYWLAVQGIYETKVFVYRMITVDPARPPVWDLGRVGIAASHQVNQDFRLILVRTEGDVTRLFAENTGRSLSAMPADVEQLDQVQVTQTAEPACPPGN